MKKRLEEMSLEELWELFPIVLVPHNPEWKECAKEEIGVLLEIFAEYHPQINHIGSTAIPGIYAKPIVDILVEVSNDVSWDVIKNVMVNNGYICMSESGNRLSFNKGYTPEGYAEKVFHVHFHRLGDNDEILFRDYMITHPETAKEYEQLKLGLLPEYKNNRDGYTDAKTEFVKSIVAKASRCIR